MNLVDLPDLMRERTEHDPVPVLAESRIESIRHRVVVGRRRRVAGTLAAVAAVALAGFGISVPLLHSDTPKVSAPASIKKINGFPEYADGGHVVGTATGTLSGGPLTVTITPTGVGFLFTNACAAITLTTEIMIDVTVNGHETGSMSCTDTPGGGYSSMDDWSADGVVIGKPSTFTFTPATAQTVTTDTDGTDQRTDIPMPDGPFAVAVLQELPFDQYPLPDRPSTLPKLDMSDFDFGGANPVVVKSSPTSPLLPQTYVFTFPDCTKAPDADCLNMAVTSSTPGYLALTVNGVPIGTGEFWDYSASGSGFDLSPDMAKLKLHKGERVTITITPQYVTGPWEFGISPKPIS